MTLDIGNALRDGLDRSVERNGMILFVLFFVLQTVSVVASQSALETIIPRFIRWVRTVSPEPLPPELTQMTEGFPPLAVPLPLEGAIALVFVVFVLGQTTRVISDRTFISDESDGLYEPRRWIGWATLSSIGGSILIFALFFLLILPAIVLRPIIPLFAALWGLIAIVIGLVLGLSFFFFRQKIATEDIGPIDALADSWSLVNGDRFEVLGLAVSLLFIEFAVGFIARNLFGLLGRVPGTIASITIGAALLVFSSAVAAQAYRQLQETGETTDEASDDEWVPDEKWNDPPM